MIKFNIDFSHIHTNDLKSFHYQSMFDTKPWSDLDLSVLDGMDLNIDLAHRVECLFDKLAVNPNEDINILDVLSITTIDTPKWQDSNANKVAKNWWLSLLNNNHQKQEIFACFNMCLYHHYQKINHLGIKQLIQSLLSNEFLFKDEFLVFFIKSLFNNDLYSIGKHILINKKSTPSQVFKNYPLMIDDTIKQQVDNHWLNCYLNLSEKELVNHSQIIYQWLNYNTDVVHLVKRAKKIFDNEYFDKDLQNLEKQTHKFGDIYTWLKSCSSQMSFKEKLGHDYLPILRVWIGAGNYYQLEKNVRHISFIHGEHKSERGKNISLNRYFFWTNYQQYIMDYWLLLPKYYASDYDKIAKTENIKWILGAGNVPIIILRIDKYYLIQPLVLRAPECDLVMTDDLVNMEKILNKPMIDIHEIKQIKPCLIHDFYFGWQQEMYRFLKGFNIQATSSVIKVAEANQKDFCIDGLSQPSANDKIERKTALQRWYQSAERHEIRQSQSNLRQFAKNLHIHGVV